MLIFGRGNLRSFFASFVSDWGGRFVARRLLCVCNTFKFSFVGMLGHPNYTPESVKTAIIAGDHNSTQDRNSG